MVYILLYSRVFFFFLELDKLLAKKSSDPRELQVVEAMENICQVKYFSTYDYSPPTTIKACKFLIGKFLFLCCNGKHNSACLLMLMRTATFFCLFGLVLIRADLKESQRGPNPYPFLSFFFLSYCNQHLNWLWLFYITKCRGGGDGSVLTVISSQEVDSSVTLKFN